MPDIRAAFEFVKPLISFAQLLGTSFADK